MGLAYPFRHSNPCGCPVLVAFSATGRGLRLSQLRKKNDEYYQLPPRIPSSGGYDADMPWGLKHFQEARCLHFLTFSCYGRAPLLGTARARDIFEQTFEQTRQCTDSTSLDTWLCPNTFIC